ncbi:MAG: PIN domain-containing protein [Phycisphaerales bacterium]
MIEEASAGDEQAAGRRMKLLEGLDVLGVERGAEELALAVRKALDIPDKARIDAYHIAYAMFYEMDYLLTWNCAHIANGAAMRRLADFVRRENLWLPIIVTPLELMDEQEG